MLSVENICYTKDVFYVKICPFKEMVGEVKLI
jgi:hypothetical protein